MNYYIEELGATEELLYGVRARVLDAVIELVRKQPEERRVRLLAEMGIIGLRDVVLIMRAVKR